jgi:drug/metabolite transporter (DMT)-like permease
MTGRTPQAARRGGVIARAIGLGDGSGPRGGAAATAEGAMLMVASTFFLAGSNAMVPVLSPEIHPFVSGFILNLVGLLTVWPWLRREGWGVLRMKAPKLHLVRGVIGAATLMAWMWSLAEIDLAKATALSFTAPLFAAAAAAIFLREKVSRGRWLALGVGFAGTLVILRPGVASLDLGTGVALLAAVGMAAMYLTTKMLLERESTASVMVNTVVVMTPLTLLTALPVISVPPGSLLPAALAMGVLGTLGRVLLTRALEVADTSSVMPFDFGRLVFIALLGFVFFDQTPDLWTCIGSAIIAASAIAFARLETRAARRAITPAAILPPPATGDPTCSPTKRP